MPRIFWKFFAIIWLILVLTVTVTVAIINAIQPKPFVREMEVQQSLLALHQTANLLESDGLPAAVRFVRASEAAQPLGLQIARAPDPRVCSDRESSEHLSVRKAGVCYQISVRHRDDILFDSLPLLMPWLAILLASTISAATLAQYLVRPLMHLRRGLSALAGGRFDVRIEAQMAGRRDEITALAHDFDTSAARLQQLQDAQQRLFHDVSHELRSPLSRLQAAVGVLRQSPSKLGAILDRMDREVERLDTLVGEILTLAKMRASSTRQIQTQTLDVIDLLHDIVDNAAFEAAARSVTIKANVEGSFLADVDGELIYRALENVVRNAIHYTAEHSQVLVRCETTVDSLKIEVCDQGPGVSRDDLERIFLPFSRGTNAIAREGFGLGLAITRQAVEQHGGRVYAHLPEKGGLAITIELPGKSLHHSTSEG